MNITAGLLLIFLNVFLPGLIFLRFYYTGEFSKQFSTKVPIIRLAFFALIPGLIFLKLGVAIYNWCNNEFTVLKAITVFSELLNSPKDYSCTTVNFLNNQVSTYAIFTIILNLSALIVAVLSHKAVRKMGLDIKYKLLRFRNQWYYVFNGDILKYKKYKAVNFVNQDEHKSNEIMMASADILVNESGGTKLYSGIVMDYDLDPTDSNSLDKIYLFDAHRYKKNTHVNNSVTIEKIKIPGQIFVILNSNILNINLTYVPSPIEKIKKNISKERSKIRIKNFKEKLNLIRFPFIILFSILLFKSNSSLLPLNFIQSEYNVFQKLFLIINVLTIFSLLVFDKTPFEKVNENDDAENEDFHLMRIYNLLKNVTITLIIFNTVILLYEIYSQLIWGFLDIS